MSAKQPRCEFCSLSFAPDPYNVSHQKYCTRPECVRERRRRRQREWHAKRYAQDPAFAAAARERCAAANRRRRAAGRSETGARDDPAVLKAVVVGILSQLTDTVDPVQLRTSLHDYAARGQRLAVGLPAVPGPP